MKHYLLLLLFPFFFNCCSSNENQESKTIMIDPKEIRPNEVVHESLSATQIEKIKQIQSTFSEVFPVSLEETITNFKRDANPDKEIAIWLGMAAAYQKFFNAHSKETSLEKKEEVFKLLLSRSMMSPEEAIKNSNLKILTNAEAGVVLSFYSDDPKPVGIIYK